MGEQSPTTSSCHSLDVSGPRLVSRWLPVRALQGSAAQLHGWQPGTTSVPGFF